MTNKLRILTICTVSSAVLMHSITPSIALATNSGFDTNGNRGDVNTDVWEEYDDTTPGTDQGTYQSPSGSGEPLPEGTPEPPSAINDFAFGYHCEHPVSYESGHLMFPTFWRCIDPPPSDTTPSAPPSTRTILRRAAATIHADGAGINKQPPTVSYTNRFVPTIVSVTNPTQTHVINLLGRDITITLTATNYEYNWGDGTPNTITTLPGLGLAQGDRSEQGPTVDPPLLHAPAGVAFWVRWALPA